MERRRVPELASRAGEVPLDGLEAQPQLTGDLTMASSLGDEQHNLLLDRGQLGYRQRIAPSPRRVMLRPHR